MRSQLLSIDDVRALDRPAEAAVVIDVMRAFTTAAWAFGRGAERIVLAESDQEALALKAAHPHWLSLKDSAPTPGFDLVNSPGKIRQLDLAGRTIVQRTTAGTVGARAAQGAGLLLCASFAVAGATAELLRRHSPAEVTYVVTGEGGRAEEDLACAEYLAADLEDALPDPTPYLHRVATSDAAADLASGRRAGYDGIHDEDVPLCLELDTFDFAMAATLDPDGLLALHPVRVDQGVLPPAGSTVNSEPATRTSPSPSQSSQWSYPPSSGSVR
ncbi:2-phosphosulfolactate phosphatase [Kitasatospora sp. NPDC002227]|uniref:2-phosphosulfolactate phosphatase n=1 Tax=Kitasatospora sp. NPDC002227 TaxID=3154773 RepID=UPI003318CF6F